MALSAVSELLGITTISDNDLLMVSHTTDGGQTYTSNKITYGTLKSAIVGASDQDGSDADDIAQSLAPYLFYQLGTPVVVKTNMNETLRLNGLSLVTLSTMNVFSINGVPCDRFNAYRSTVDGNYYYNSYIGYPNDRITCSNGTNTAKIAIAPFLNVAGEQLENSDFYYSATLNLKDFYDKFTNNTLSTYSSLFNYLNMDYGNYVVDLKNGILGKDNITCFKNFILPIAPSSDYVVTVSYAPPPSSVYVYSYRESSGRFSTQGKIRPTVKIWNKKISISAGYYMKLTDVNFRITIMKVYENV